MHGPPRNLFASLPDGPVDELVEVLNPTSAVRIERIVSTGQCSPDGFWYDQREAEWVVLLRGAARLEYEDGSEELRPGDWVYLAPHRRHRVAWTDPHEATVWLAVFYPADPSEETR
jgi:cupin 2 domain-containing protein